MTTHSKLHLHKETLRLLSTGEAAMVLGAMPAATAAGGQAIPSLACVVGNSFTSGHATCPPTTSLPTTSVF